MNKIWVLSLVLLVAACQPLRNGEYTVSAPEHDILVEVSGLQNAAAQKLAIIQHGLAVNRLHPVVEVAKQTFLNAGYVVVTFDGRHSLGKSGVDVENATLASFAEDLRLVTDWAHRQGLGQKHLVLVGHSLGGAAVLQHAWQNPAETNLIVVIAPVVSGQRWKNACMQNMPDFCRQWEQQKIYLYQDPKTGQTAQIAWQTLESAKSYDAVVGAADISAAVVLIGAQEDKLVPPADIEALYKAIRTPKQMSIIPSSGHNFASPQNQQALGAAIAAGI